MATPVPLNNVDHADVRVRTGHGGAFGDAVNQVLAFPTEFDSLQREYPILFTRDDGELKVIVLLGLQKDENLFLGPSGWDACYVPAVQQRGPFSIAMERGEGGRPQSTLFVDLEHARITADDGEALFLKHGGETPYLQHVRTLLRILHIGAAAAPHMIAAFEDLKLIEPVALELTVSEGVTLDLEDYFTISPARLAQLRGAELDALHQDGFLAPAFAIAASLSNVQALVARKQRFLRTSS
jgi:SapC